jgi:Flp pilus assembly protein TadB
VSLVIILIIVAGILALLDLILGFTYYRTNSRSWSLLPWAVLLIVIAMLIGAGGIHT